MAALAFVHWPPRRAPIGQEARVTAAAAAFGLPAAPTVLSDLAHQAGFALHRVLTLVSASSC